jgi:homoserine dehydrogenase
MSPRVRPKARGATPGRVPARRPARAGTTVRTADAKGRQIGVGLIGFGTIGTGVVKLLAEGADAIKSQVGCPVRLVRIADLDLDTDRGVRVGRRLLTNDAGKLIDDPRVDIVIELIGGYEPARQFVLRALRAGKPVVTANKALLAVHGGELLGEAEQRGVDIGFEASVGGGIPIIRTLKEGLAGDRNRAVYGIVNGTSNYILSTMTQAGESFGDVLRAAQQQGLAEADPTFDVDGTDAAHKLTLLATLAFGVQGRFAEVHREGIEAIEPMDIAFARELGYAIKLLAIAKDHGDAVEMRVHPTMIPQRHVLADVGGAYNAIYIQGDALGSSMYFGLGAGMMPTATAVVADVMEIGRAILHGDAARVPPVGRPMGQLRTVPTRPIGEIISEFYLRFMVQDRPGVLARIAGILGDDRISIASVIQKEREHQATVPIVIRTHAAPERNLRRALDKIGELREVKGTPILLRIEDNLG